MNKMRGFTLIELMITIAIIGILAAMAYPSYMESIRRTHRSDAMAELSDIATRLQRCYTTNTTYNSAAGVCAIKDNVTSNAGVTSSGGYYVIKGSGFTATAYTLTATPVSGGSQAADKSCLKMLLDQSGKKSSFNDSNADTTTTCWK